MCTIAFNISNPVILSGVGDIQRFLIEAKVVLIYVAAVLLAQNDARSCLFLLHQSTEAGSLKHKIKFSV